MVDNLCSATELAIQSCLLLIHYGKFSIYQGHLTTKEIFFAYTNAGNMHPKYKEHFSNLKGLRLGGRYQRGYSGKKFELEESQAASLLNLTQELMNIVDSLLRTKDMSRNPSVSEGYVISIGQG